MLVKNVVDKLEGSSLIESLVSEGETGVEFSDGFSVFNVGGKLESSSLGVSLEG